MENKQKEHEMIRETTEIIMSTLCKSNGHNFKQIKKDKTPHNRLFCTICGLIVKVLTD